MIIEWLLLYNAFISASAQHEVKRMNTTQNTQIEGIYADYYVSRMLNKME
ncbi:MAG: hypothetical protein PHO85_03410 [Candidatus Cloacimonetes bacterium]|nr:hypothetical protein [Candidatus Cloacimonadota bacterium]MDD2506100.1 hypothetical protein [Candidatus Cloacimonadota bacterium]MDD4147550.1 hypothetical protein [Candidatus Cloacimonadota bacterium]MDD4559683.1 hypothetical protein [Candidatus Cloacimonadota bacterium]